MKLLIDECLSPELTKRAQAAGYGELSHVVWLKLAGRKDWQLKSVILVHDWTFVTRNSVDFRGPVDRPGAKGQYADVMRGRRGAAMAPRKVSHPPRRHLLQRQPALVG